MILLLLHYCYWELDLVLFVWGKYMLIFFEYLFIFISKVWKSRTWQLSVSVSKVLVIQYVSDPTPPVVLCVDFDLRISTSRADRATWRPYYFLLFQRISKLLSWFQIGLQLFFLFSVKIISLVNEIIVGNFCKIMNRMLSCLSAPSQIILWAARMLFN